MGMVDAVKARLIPDVAHAHKLRSVQVAGAGAIAGAVAAGLAASGAIVPWLGTIPDWAVFAGGAVICVLTIIARLWRQTL